VDAPSNGRLRLAFGLFEAYVSSGELRKRGQRVHLQVQPFQLLSMLLERPGEVVTREEVQKKLWPDGTFVDFDEGLDTALKKLRYALGDSAQNPTFIETIPRRGYRFLATVEQPPEPARQESLRASAWLTPLRIFLISSTIAVIAVGALLLIFYFHLASPLPLDIKRITTAGNVQSAAISRDGRYLAYATAEGEGKLALWLEQVPTLAGTQLLPPARLENLVPSFSPDGNLLYFAQFEPARTEGELYVMPMLGGVPRKLFSDVMSSAGVSPDGKWLAFLRANPGAEKDPLARELVVGAADGSALRTIARGHWLWESDRHRELRPDWSPDGMLVAAPTVDANGVHHLGIFPTSPGGKKQFLLGYGWDALDQPVWMPDGRSLIIYGWEPRQPQQLCEVSYPGGGVRRISSGTDKYWTLSVSGDGRSLAAVRREELSSIWIAPYDAPDRGRPITRTPSHAGIVSLAWTRDGQILYERDMAGGIEIHIMAADGSGSHLLPLKPMRAALYSTCPDGTLIFCVVQGGRWRIWRSARDGSDDKFITDGEGETEPQCTPDGKWVVYDSFSSRRVFKVPVDGGSPVQVSSRTLSRPILSLDGRWLAVLLDDPNQPTVEFSKLAILDFATGTLTKSIDLHPLFDGSVWHWTRDGKALIYADHPARVANLWLQPINGGPSRQLTHFTSEGVQWFDLSPDGRHIAMARISAISDAVLIAHFR
jgi:DNA-binding winged helix-turn-helix (wHTH) protein/Tol biopolymer transport system component